MSAQILSLRPLDELQHFERDKIFEQRIVAAALVGDADAVSRIDRLRRKHDDLAYDENRLYETNLIPLFGWLL